MMVGVPKSGKTVYLALLNHFFSTGGEIAPGLKLMVTPLTAEDRLAAKYRQIISPDPHWPLGTKPTEIPRWTFECHVMARSETYQIMNITYLDYAGEWLTKGGELARD